MDPDRNRHRGVRSTEPRGSAAALRVAGGRARPPSRRPPPPGEGRRPSTAGDEGAGPAPPRHPPRDPRVGARARAAPGARRGPWDRGRRAFHPTSTPGGVRRGRGPYGISPCPWSPTSCWRCTAVPQGNSSGGASPRSQNGRTSQAGNRCRPEIVLAYAITGFGIVVLSGLTTKVYNVPLSAQLGLFQLLPPAYWIGLSLIAASTVISAWRGSDVLVAVTGIILLATLAGTPSLFEPTPRYWDAYVHFAESQSFMVSGRLSSNPSSYSANWPGAFLVIWTVSAASGVPSIEFLGLFPFLTGGLTFLAIFELVRSISSPIVARQVSVPTALFAVWAQYHVSPQSLGFVLLLMVLATCRRRETTWRLIAVTLFGGLVVSHPTSSILLL